MAVIILKAFPLYIFCIVKSKIVTLSVAENQDGLIHACAPYGHRPCDSLKQGEWECFDWFTIEYESSSSEESSDETEESYLGLLIDLDCLAFTMSNLQYNSRLSSISSTISRCCSNVTLKSSG